MNQPVRWYRNLRTIVGHVDYLVCSGIHERHYNGA